MPWRASSFAISCTVSWIASRPAALARLARSNLPAVAPFSDVYKRQEQEIEMGRQTAMQLEAKYGVVQDYALQERVNRIGQSLVKVSEQMCIRDRPKPRS